MQVNRFLKLDSLTGFRLIVFITLDIINGNLIVGESASTIFKVSRDYVRLQFYLQYAFNAGKHRNSYRDGS